MNNMISNFGSILDKAARVPSRILKQGAYAL